MDLFCKCQVAQRRRYRPRQMVGMQHQRVWNTHKAIWEYRGMHGRHNYVAANLFYTLTKNCESSYLRRDCSVQRNTWHGQILCVTQRNLVRGDGVWPTCMFSIISYIPRLVSSPTRVGSEMLAKLLNPTIDVSTVQLEEVRDPHMNPNTKCQFVNRSPYRVLCSCKERAVGYPCADSVQHSIPLKGRRR